MIDSGAELSLINQKIIEQNSQQFYKKQLPIRSINLRTFNNKKISECKKTCMGDVEIGETKGTMEFLIVPNLVTDCIIGIENLTKWGIIINAEERNITCNGQIIEWISNDEGDIITTTEGEHSPEETMTTQGAHSPIVGEYRGEEDILSPETSNEKTDAHSRQCSIQATIHEINVSEQDKLVNIQTPEEQRETVEKLLRKYPNLSNEENRTAQGYVHQLEVNDDQPYNSKMYPIPFKYREKVKEKINEMLRNDIIEKSKTYYVNPLVVVKKTSGDIRLCLDARKINQITKPQYESPQRIDSMLGRLGQVKFLTKLDLKNSFWLIPLHEKSRKYTGFCVEGQIYQFKVVPFGLSSATAALVRALQHILNPFEHFCLSYIDDILIYSKDEQEHIEHIEIILQKLDEAGLKLNLEKCQFFQSTVKFLGYKVTREGTCVDSERLIEIKNYKRPHNLRSLRGFLGILQYYKRFVNNMSQKAVALYELLKKGRRWKWSTTEENAFIELKNSFYESLLLRHPNFNLPFILRTDASDHAISAELLQVQDDIEVPICFISRILKKHELKYSIVEKEMLAIIYSLEKLKFYLAGNKFMLVTDNIALTFMKKTRFANSRIYRWTLLAQEFDFEIVHRKGKENVTADALTRQESSAKFKTNDVLIALNKMKNIEGIYSEAKIKEDQQKEEITQLKKLVQTNTRYKGYEEKNGFLIKKIQEKELYVVTKEYATEVVKDLHETYGHIGSRKTWLLFRENYFATKDYLHTKNYIRTCRICQMAKHRNFTNAGIQKSIEVERPLQIVAADYIGNLINTEDGNRNIFVMVDIFTKYVKLYLTKKCNSETTIDKIEHFIQTVGTPARLLVDNATYFRSDTFVNHWKNRGVKIIFCSIRHPSGNPAEKYVQQTTQFLRIFTHDQHSRWDQYVQLIENFINNVPNIVTQETPHYLMTGQRSERPWEEDSTETRDQLLVKVHNRLKKYWYRRKEKEMKRAKKKAKFEVGDLVLLRDSKEARRMKNICGKLKLIFKGPYVIVHKYGDTYRLKERDTEKDIGKHHISNLYLYQT